MSNKVFKSLACAVLLAASSVAFATPKILPFGPGERLEYNLYAFGTNAGRLKIGVIDQGEYQGHSLMSLAAKLEPVGFMQLLWEGESRRTSFLDVGSLLPLRVIDIEETRSRTWKTQMDFDGSGGVSFTRFGTKPDGSDSVTKRQVPIGILETLTGLYNLRTRELKIGEHFTTEILDNGRIYKLDFKVDRKEDVRGVLGKEEALVVKLEARRLISKPPTKSPNKRQKAPAAKPSAAGTIASLGIALPSEVVAASQPVSTSEEAPVPPDVSAEIWFSTSRDRIPLRFEVDMYKVGSMTAELSRYTPAE